MNDHAEIEMLMYRGKFSNDELHRLKPHDNEVAKALIDAGIAERGVWTVRSETVPRTVELAVTLNGKRIVIAETQSEELGRNLLDRVRDGLKRMRFGNSV